MKNCYYLFLVILLYNCSSIKKTDILNPSFELENKKIKIESQFLNFQYYKDSKFKIDQIVYGDFHKSRNNVEYVIPIYYLYSTNKNDASFLSIRFYSEDEFINCIESPLFNKEFFYRDCTIQIGNENSDIKMGLRLVKKIKTQSNEYLVEYIYRPMNDNYLREKSILEIADLFVDSYIE